MTTLRPYQEVDIGRLRAEYARGKRKVCYAAPTGSGKTAARRDRGGIACRPPSFPH
jgi:superfamily II DNA or RNA helicase